MQLILQMKMSSIFLFEVKHVVSRSFRSSLLSVLLVIGNFAPFLAYGKEFIAYLPSWRIDKFSIGKENISPKSLTAINYAFLGVCWNGAQGNSAHYGEKPCTLLEGVSEVKIKNGTITSWNPDLDRVNLMKLLALRSENPTLRILISVGGATWSNQFSNIAQSEEARNQFAASATRMIRVFGLDGIDIDWEAPVEAGTLCSPSAVCHRATDKVNFLKLLRALRDALTLAGKTDNKNYLITIASGYHPSYINDRLFGSSSWLRNASDYIDWFNVMTYEFNGTWNDQSGHAAALYKDRRDRSPHAANKNADNAIKRYLAAGVSKEKIVLGESLYAHIWKECPGGSAGDGLNQTCAKGARFPSLTFGDLIEDGYLTPDATGRFSASGKGFIRYWSKASSVPYLYNPNTKEFISYSDEESLTLKLDYVESNGLRGLMLWDISADRHMVMQNLLAAANRKTSIASPTK